MTQICPTAVIKRLLLPTDGSEYSEGAVREAINLAEASSARIIAVYVVKTNQEFEAIAPELIENAGKEAREHLESVKERAFNKGVECETIVCHGEEPYRCIVDEAEKNGINMIVMGRRGRTGIKRLMLGSVTAKVIGAANSNVLVVPKEAEIDCRNIIAATDGSQYGDAAVYEAIAIAKRCKAGLTVVTVITSEDLVHLGHSRQQVAAASEEEKLKVEHSIRKLKEAAAKEGVLAECLMLSGVPEEEIISLAKTKNADLIVLGRHGKTGIDKILVGSVADRVIVLASSAVLVVKSG